MRPAGLSNLMAKSATTTTASAVARSTRTVNGRTVETLRAGTSGGASQSLGRLVVVPGNPGAASFYTELVGGLAARLENWEFEAVSHLGHSPLGTCDRTGAHEVFGVESQIAHHADVLREARKEIGDGKHLVVAGHSIGAHYALQAVRLAGLQADERVHVLALNPFLRFSWRVLGQASIAPLAAAWPLAAALVAAVSWLPRALQRRVAFALGGGIKAPTVERVLDLLGWFVPANALGMALSEFRALHREPDWEAPRALEGRVTMVYSNCYDRWAPPQDQEAARSELPDARFHVTEGPIAHGWPGCPDESEAMAGVVAGLVVENVVSRKQAPARA